MPARALIGLWFWLCLVLSCSGQSKPAENHTASRASASLTHAQDAQLNAFDRGIAALPGLDGVYQRGAILGVALEESIASEQACLASAVSFSTESERGRWLQSCGFTCPAAEKRLHSTPASRWESVIASACGAEHLATQESAEHHAGLEWLMARRAGKLLAPFMEAAGTARQARLLGLLASTDIPLPFLSGRHLKLPAVNAKVTAPLFARTYIAVDSSGQLSVGHGPVARIEKGGAQWVVPGGGLGFPGARVRPQAVRDDLARLRELLPEQEDAEVEEIESGGTGTKMSLEEGKMGRRASRTWVLRGDSPLSPAEARRQALEAARASGILDVLDGNVRPREAIGADRPFGDVRLLGGRDPVFATRPRDALEVRPTEVRGGWLTGDKRAFAETTVFAQPAAPASDAIAALALGAPAVMAVSVPDQSRARALVWSFTAPDEPTLSLPTLVVTVGSKGLWLSRWRGRFQSTELADGSALGKRLLVDAESGRLDQELVVVLVTPGSTARGVAGVLGLLAELGLRDLVVAQGTPPAAWPRMVAGPRQAP